jgi:uncharacterized iron-regulated membrane protein
VHLYSPDGTGRIAYVHPETLEVLKTVAHTSRVTEIVKMIHGELLIGRNGSLLVELAASWAVVMLITGLYLWWPRDARRLAGAVYPRLRGGRRVFWRDLHAVTGLWVSAFALFLLITAMPWTAINGEAIGTLRGWVAPAPRDWSTVSTDVHAAHRQAVASAAVATPLKVDEIIARIAPYELDPPVRLYLPNERQPHWRVAAETRNLTKARELALDRMSGALLREDGFAYKSALDKTIHVGISAHEGALFGWANQALGLFTALGLITMCVSAIVMWWRRRPDGKLGIPAPRVAEFRVRWPLAIGIVTLGVLFPVLGLSLVVLWIWDQASRLMQRFPAH